MIDSSIKTEKEKHEEFRKRLGALINEYSLENLSDTPDFILANYLYSCLLNFSYVLAARTKWYGEGK